MIATLFCVAKTFSKSFVSWGSSISGISNERCGASVSLSDDRTLMVVGCPNSSNGVGRVRIFTTQWATVETADETAHKPALFQTNSATYDATQCTAHWSSIVPAVTAAYIAALEITQWATIETADESTVSAAVNSAITAANNSAQCTAHWPSIVPAVTICTLV